MPILETSSLTKRYPDGTLAVDGVDLRINAGMIYALLGPNGAGKTTIIAMLTTLLQPTGGQAHIAGCSVINQPGEVRKRIGVTFQEIVLDRDLKGREVLDYHGQLYSMPRRDRQARIAELLGLVELVDNADKLVKHYSGGMKRRLELARGLMTDPAVLFLDEPTQGLDPQNRARIWEYLKDLRQQRGLTTLLTTHDMEEAETLADQVGIIDGGRLVAEGSPSGLVDELGTDVINLAGKGNTQEVLNALTQMPYVKHVHHVDGRLQIGVDDGNRRLAEIVSRAAKNNYQIEEIGIDRPRLGDVFLRHTGHILRD